MATRTDQIAFSGRIDRLDARARGPGRGGLQDRAGTCSPWTTPGPRWRWPCTRWPPGGCCAGRAAGWNCTTCPPATCWPGSTRPSRWPAAGPGTGHRRRVRRRRRGATGSLAAPAGRRGVPAPPRPAVRLVRLPRALPRGQRGGASPAALGRPGRDRSEARDSRRRPGPRTRRAGPGLPGRVPSARRATPLGRRSRTWSARGPWCPGPRWPESAPRRGCRRARRASRRAIRSWTAGGQPSSFSP